MSSPGGQQQGFPQLDSHFVDEERMILYPWYRLLVALWQLSTGSGQIPVYQAVFFKQISPGEIEAFDTSEGGLIGTLRLKDFPGAVEEPQTVGSSPFNFTAPGDGTFVASSCKIELSRAGGFYLVSLTGGAVPMMRNDVVRLSWNGPDPVAVWFPAG